MSGDFIARDYDGKLKRFTRRKIMDEKYDGRDIIARVTDINFYPQGGICHIDVYMTPPGEKLRFSVRESFILFYEKIKDVFVWKNTGCFDWILESKEKDGE